MRWAVDVGLELLVLFFQEKRTKINRRLGGRGEADGFGLDFFASFLVKQKGRRKPQA